MTHFSSNMERHTKGGSTPPFWANWADDSSHQFDPRRITACLPPTKSWSENASRAKSDVIEPHMERGYLLEFNSSVDSIVPPRQQAENTRELIETVRRESDARRIREVAQLHKKIEVLTRRIALLESKKSPVDLGKIVVLHEIAIPARLERVIAAIEESWPLLELPEDWDDNGALPFAESTLRRAAGFLVEFATTLAIRRQDILEDVEILPGSNGGLDIDLRLGNRELLISVPADVEKEARFYGDDGRGGNQVKATTSTSSVPGWLLGWLVGE